MLEVTAPYDGNVIGELEQADAIAIDDALRLAYSLFRDRAAWLPTHERVAVLERTADLLAGQHEALALQAANEGGKPIIDSRVEVTRAVDGLRLAAETIRTQSGEVVPIDGTAAGADRTAFTQPEPHRRRRRR